MNRLKIFITSLLMLSIASSAMAAPVYGYSRRAPVNSLATLFSPKTGEKVVVFLNDKETISNLFALDFKLFTKADESSNGQLGISLPTIVAVFQTSLASRLTSSATSTMTLVSGTTADGSTLSGYYAFIIDEGSSNQEFITATCAATACTGLTRGISVVDGKTSVTALKKDHGRGASVKITNYPQLTLLTNIFKGTETIDAVMSYGSSIVTSSFSGINNLVSKGYADGLAIAGSPDSTTSTKGIGKISSAPAVASSPVFLNSEEVYATTTANGVVRANSSGKIATSFIDQTQNYTWSGTSTFTGTTTINGFNVSSYTFGDASDGDAVISSITTSSRDMYYNDLTINSGIVLNPGGYKIFVKGTLTFVGTGKIARDGTNGGNASSQTAGAASSALADGTIPGSVAGGIGIAGAANNTDGANGTTLAAQNPSLGSAGGTGGVGGRNSGFGYSLGAGGTATVTASKKFIHTIIDSMTLNELLSGAVTQQKNSNSGGSGGSGSCGNGGGAVGGGSGGGGSSGGMIAVYARNIVTVDGNTYIQSLGGNGGNGGNGTGASGAAGMGGGGGGGGAGGVVIVVYTSKTGTGVITVTGGTGGTAGTNGSGSVERSASAGSSGTSGATYLLSVPF